VSAAFTQLTNVSFEYFGQSSDHRMKTFHDGWHDQPFLDGTIIWTSPTGETYRTVPGAVDLFPDLVSKPAMRRNRFAATILASEHRASLASAAAIGLSGPSTRHTAGSKLQVGGRANPARPRNRMRKMLFLLEGRPSTSPSCAWINDWMEPKELPSDWRPPPDPPPLPDDPPF
jgi:hypothetical protein